MAETRVHAITLKPCPRLQGLVEALRRLIQVQARGGLIMQIERESSVVELRAHPASAAKSSGKLHLFDRFGGQSLAGFIVLGECLEQLLVAEEFLQHLRRDLDEVAFRR